MSLRTIDMRLVYVNQLFNATLNEVCDAWLNPAMVKQWLFKVKNNQVIDVKINPQPGGQFAVTTVSKNGETVEYYGVFQQVECPNLLMFSLQAPKAFEGVSIITVDLQATKNGCELNFTQTGVPPEITEDGWRERLSNLARLLDK